MTSTINETGGQSSNNVNAKAPCSHCKTRYLKNILHLHEAECVSSRTCPWCNTVFKNRGNLASHKKHVHKDKRTRSLQDGNVSCDVCDIIFDNILYLKYHIRQEHYKLKTKIALRNKKLNQIWFERVLNSNVIVRISKAENNMLLIQKYGTVSDNIEVDENYSDIDLSSIYPMQS